MISSQWFILLALILIASVASTSVSWTSATTFEALSGGTATEGNSGKNLIIKFSLTTGLTVQDQFISIKSNTDWTFAQPMESSDMCTFTKDGGSSTISVKFSTGHLGDPRLQEIKIILTGGTLPAGAYTLSCPSVSQSAQGNVGILFSSITRTFDIYSSTDSDPLISQTGFPVTAKSASSLNSLMTSITVDSGTKAINGFKFQCTVPTAHTMGSFLLFKSQTQSLWTQQGALTCTALQVSPSIADISSQLDFFGTTGSTSGKTLNALKVTVKYDSNGVAEIAAGATILISCSSSINTSPPPSGPGVFKYLGSSDATETTSLQISWNIFCNSINDLTSPDINGLCAGSGNGLKVAASTTLCTEVASSTWFAGCTNANDASKCCDTFQMCNSVTDSTTPSITSLCGTRGLIDAASSTKCAAPSGCTVANDAATCCKAGAKCSTLTSSSSPTLESTCTGGSYTGALISAASSTDCAGTTCITSDASTCCQVKAKCSTLTSSSSPTLESTCTGGSYTGALISAATSTDCAGATCSTSDASTCCVQASGTTSSGTTSSGTTGSGTTSSGTTGSGTTSTGGTGSGTPVIRGTTGGATGSTTGSATGSTAPSPEDTTTTVTEKKLSGTTTLKCNVVVLVIALFVLIPLHEM
jgi:hypothetical protein